MITFSSFATNGGDENKPKKSDKKNDDCIEAVTKNNKTVEEEGIFCSGRDANGKKVWCLLCSCKNLFAK